MVAEALAQKIEPAQRWP